MLGNHKVFLPQTSILLGQWRGDVASGCVLSAIIELMLQNKSFQHSAALKHQLLMRPHPLTGQLESADPGGAGLDLALHRGLSSALLQVPLPLSRKVTNLPGASSHRHERGFCFPF